MIELLFNPSLSLSLSLSLFSFHSILNCNVRLYIASILLNIFFALLKQKIVNEVNVWSSQESIWWQMSSAYPSVILIYCHTFFLLQRLTTNSRPRVQLGACSVSRLV